MATPTNPSTPAGACDCHMHVYDDGYPLAPTATFKPPHAPLTAYRQMQKALGLARVVLIQATGYGFDNRLLLDSLAQLGSDSARGIVIVPPELSDDELQRLHDTGVRGVRYFMLNASGLLAWDTLETMAARIAPLGWHIDLQLDGRELPQHQAMIDRLPGKLVIDHTGKFLEPVPPDDAAFKALLSVLDKDQRWVKLSAPYETSKRGAPHYEDVAVLAKALVTAHPDRCLWASNWPHPNFVPPPSDADLLALLGEWAGDEAVRQSILVHNPAALYGFKATPPSGPRAG